MLLLLGPLLAVWVFPGCTYTSYRGKNDLTIKRIRFGVREDVDLTEAHADRHQHCAGKRTCIKGFAIYKFSFKLLSSDDLRVILLEMLLLIHVLLLIYLLVVVYLRSPLQEKAVQDKVAVLKQQQQAKQHQANQSAEASGPQTGESYSSWIFFLGFGLGLHVGECSRGTAESIFLCFYA